MLTKSPLLSIIIPVYNVEDYLSQCIDSVLNQSFRDYEIILVDDGSTDRCPALCDEYAAVEERIMIVHKENVGASGARNSGADAASGKYLLFIDSDDYIEKDSLEKIAQYLIIDGDCDVIFLNSIGFLKDGSYTDFGYTYNKDMVYKKSRNEVLEYFISISQFPVAPFTKLIRRQFIMDKNISFTEGLDCCNDLDHMIGLIIAAESFNCFDFPFYYYRCFREGSLSTGRHDKLFRSLLFIFEKWDTLSKKECVECASVIHRILAFEYCPLLWHYYNLNKKEKPVYKNSIKKFAFLMSLSNDKRIILTNIVYKIFGLSIVSCLINYYYIVKFRFRR